MKVSFSPAAQADLLDIALYIAQDNPTRALSFVGELEAKCLRLGQVSGIGTVRPEHSPTAYACSHMGTT